MLPLVDLSAEKNEEYFANGLTAELLGELGKNPQLRVMGRASTIGFNQSQEDARAIGAALGVSTLLEGSVRRSGNRVRITAANTWVALMAIVALSSFFIWTIRLVWLFSPIHLISIFTLAMLWRGYNFARKHDIRHHMLTMEFTYFLALVVTGLLTFLPGRIMYQVAFGPDGATPQKIMIFGAIVVTALILSGVVMVVRRRQLKTVVT